MYDFSKLSCPLAKGRPLPLDPNPPPGHRGPMYMTTFLQIFEMEKL